MEIFQFLGYFDVSGNNGKDWNSDLLEVIFKTPGSMFGHESRIGAQEVHAIRFEDGDKKNQP